jgi:rSAM/selenodomain-associated transferase 1
VKAPVVLVMAKAPVPGQVKTRLAATVGPAHAADLAAASLLDTIDVCEAAFRTCHISLAGELGGATCGPLIAHRLAHWTVHPQAEGSLGDRLARAHHDTARSAEAPVVQIGMDTPQVSADHLLEVARALTGFDAVLGPAVDGGWWVLGLRDPQHAQALADVPMSTPTTYRDTRAALERSGASVGRGGLLADVDTASDAEAVAALVGGSRFAAAWAGVR